MRTIVSEAAAGKQPRMKREAGRARRTYLMGPRALLLLAIPSFLWAQTGAPELRIPPIKTQLQIDGQTADITAWGTVRAASAGRFKVSLTADLGELEQKITPLMRSELNRSEHCGDRLSVDHASLVPAAPTAVLTAYVHYERWGCAKAFGREIVKRLAGGDATIVVNITPSADGGAVALAAEVQKIDAGGSLGELLNSGSLGTALRDNIAHSVQAAIQKGVSFQSSLPPPLAGAVAVNSVRFADGGNARLWLALAGEVRISAEQFQSLAREMKPQ